jgi:hypothetical protein
MLTLLTDFGTQDVYVGVMKGVIAQINPTVPVVDLTHAIPPQDVAAARFHWMNAVPYFPAGTVHVCVVDPGVGGARRAIALRLGDMGYLVAPDNGVVSGVLDPVSSHIPPSALAAVELTNPDYWRTETPSATFHGRDIFAPVGAHLASGVPLNQVGTPIPLESLVSLPIPPVQPMPGGVSGVVQHIDIFGNLITTIPGTAVESSQWAAQVGNTPIPGKITYGDASVGELLALVGSHGWVEIAVNHGSAAQVLTAAIGMPITIQRCTSEHNSAVL